MGSLGSPKVWVPYLNNKDCSLGFCSLYCPQLCYIIYPPPPPLDFPDDDHGGSSLTPLVVAVIGILASAFLLVSCYTIISKYCGSNNNDDDQRRRRSRSRSRSARQNPNSNGHDYPEEADEDRNPSDLHEAWHVVTAGLDEALIKAIAVCRYKRGDGFVEGTDCSVCLSEFEEDECLRVLPKCSHAFHVQCIDTWLQSHSNCPLCRANVVCAESSSTGESTGSGDQSELGSDSSSSGADHEVVISETNNNNNVVVFVTPKSSSTSTTRALSDLGNLESHSTRIEVRDEMRRSISMDFSRRDRVSVADILRKNEEEKEVEIGGDIEQCSRFGRANCSSENIDGRRFTMKRSVSSGRFFLTRSLIGAGRGKIINHSVIIPL